MKPQSSRRPTILLTWFSPQMVAIRDFHIELEDMPETTFESLLKRGGVEANFPNADYLEALEKYFGNIRIPEHREKYMRLKEDSKVIWVTRDQKTHNFRYTKVVIKRRQPREPVTPVQQELPLEAK